MKLNFVPGWANKFIPFKQTVLHTIVNEQHITGAVECQESVSFIAVKGSLYYKILLTKKICWVGL